MSHHNYKTKQFKELESRWYSKLKQSGFKDIERSDRVGKAAGLLVTGPLENILHSYDVNQFNIKEEYYRLAGQFLHEHKFDSKFEKTIWETHSQGISIENIIKALKLKGKTAYKDLVHGVIKKLASEMKTNARQE